MEELVERAIDTMWQRYSEPLSLPEIADTVILSPFYFSRVFRGVTGVSPGRFLSAIRLCEAKRLLLANPDRRVTDIAFQVGYNSLGTFTRRFTESVGMSPARFRRMPALDIPALRSVSDSAFSECSGRGLGSVVGSVCLPRTDVPTQICIGIFDGPIAQGIPPSFDILCGTTFRLDRVPAGMWYVHAGALPLGPGGARPGGGKPLYVGRAGPAQVTAGSTAHVDVPLRPKRLTDVPSLLAVPGLLPAGPAANRFCAVPASAAIQAQRIQA
jgi:AraC family transcriptional regulator